MSAYRFKGYSWGFYILQQISCTLISCNNYQNNGLAKPRQHRAHSETQCLWLKPDLNCSTINLMGKQNFYLGCCCFSPAVHSLSAPPGECHLWSDPKTGMYRAISSACVHYRHQHPSNEVLCGLFNSVCETP